MEVSDATFMAADRAALPDRNCSWLDGYSDAKSGPRPIEPADDVAIESWCASVRLVTWWTQVRADRSIVDGASTRRAFRSPRGRCVSGLVRYAAACRGA